MKVVISSGHGSKISGAVSLINEVTEARLVVHRVAEYIQLAGGQATEFHDNVSTTVTANINAITAFHNARQRDLDVSVHFNAVAGTRDEGIGTEVLYTTERVLAGKVATAISSVSGLINRGAKSRSNLGFLNKTNKPAILIEVCFVNSRADVRLYRDNFDAICRAIAETITGRKAEGIAVQEVPQWQKEAFAKLVKSGFINTPEYWEPKLGQPATNGEVLALIGQLMSRMEL